MADIRNYFGNNANQKTKKKAAARKRIIEESDEDDEPAKVTTPVVKQKESKSPIQVQAEEFFSTSKVQRSAARPRRRARPTNLEEDYGGQDLDMIDLDELDEVEKSQQSKVEQNQSAEVVPAPKPGGKRKRDEGPDSQSAIANKAKVEPQDVTMEEDESATAVSITKKSPSKKIAATTTTTTTPKRKATDKNAKQKSAENGVTSAALESIPLVALPEANEPVEFKFGQATVAALEPGSKEIPEGKENCLTGLTFVFTGILQSLERNQAQDLVKQYGGKVTTAPSKNTSYVVLGEQAGPKKIEKIGKLGIKTIDEDGLLKMIAVMPAQGGDSAAAVKAAEKRHAEDKIARDAAAAMEAAEAKLLKQSSSKGKASSAKDNVKVVLPGSQLWTTKYAPTSIKDVVGNKTLVERLSKWLADWPKSLKANFKKPGPDGFGVYRAMLISGSPGVGKTTSAHLVAKLAGYDVLEFNASDTRSKRLLEDGLKGVVNNSSLRGYFAADGADLDVGKKRLVLIMDEVDGMSAGDRGGVGALNAIIRQTTIPIICICNDRASPKLKPLDKTTFDLRFSKPTKEQVRSRIMSIAYKEGLQVQPQAIDQLVDGTGSDIRQIINLLSTYRLSASSMDQAQGRSGAKSAEKHIILKPWDIVGKFLSGANYHERSTVSLNEKIELYFNDHDLSYLMVQENYLNTIPDRMRTGGSKLQEQDLKRLQLTAKAARGISEGDLIDSMIHGPQQHWSLMPVHAVFSCVRPCSFIAGSGGGRTAFTSVLGNMSKLGKSTRLLREIRAHLRLRVSGDKHEIRRDYIPALFNRMPHLLAQRGADSIPEVIATMDEYFLSKDDYESLLELGIGENNREHIDGQIPSATKSAFTRQYNKMTHPVAFITTDVNAASRKVIAAADAPDFEDAVELDDDDDVTAVDVEKTGEEEDTAIDLKKDKLIMAPTKTTKRRRLKRKSESVYS